MLWDLTVLLVKENSVINTTNCKSACVKVRNSMVNKSWNIEQKFRVIKQLVSISLRVDTRVHVISLELISLL